MRLRALVLMSALGLSGVSCHEEADPVAPSGIYTAECDAGVSIDFGEETYAIVEENNCEGYGGGQWDWRLDGHDLVMAPAGHLDDPMYISETFRISDDGKVLTLTDSYSDFSCGNCPTGSEFVQQP